MLWVYKTRGRGRTRGGGTYLRLGIAQDDHRASCHASTSRWYETRAWNPTMLSTAISNRAGGWPPDDRSGPRSRTFVGYGLTPL